MMKCEVCGKKSALELCAWHEEAYASLREKFKDWRNALEVSWEEYLKQVKENPNTGAWAREVVDFSLKKGQTRI